MRESSLVRRIIAAIEREYSESWVRKLADAHTRGLPDLLVILPGAFVFFIEVKRPGGRKRALQEHNAELVENLQVPWLFVTSMKEALEAIKGIKFERKEDNHGPKMRVVRRES